MSVYKVREGQRFTHRGEMMEAGALIELDDRLAFELASKVDPVVVDPLETEPEGADDEPAPGRG